VRQTASDGSEERARRRRCFDASAAVASRRRAGSTHTPAPSPPPNRRRQRIDAERKALPVWAAREQLLSEVRARKVLIVVGETGSGKTTQIPQFLLQGGLAGGSSGGGGGGGSSSAGGMIACTQPRRVAAVTVARRVADEMGAQLGQQVRRMVVDG